MKKFECFLILTLGWLVSFGQSIDTISIGSVRTDGYEKVTKGAFWSTRPEAKLIEEGSIPPECTVYTLTKEYFVRFIDGEHNKEDKNYIVFPAGAKIYTKGGKYYSSKCGNQIEYLRPVNMVKVIEKPVEKIVEVPVVVGKPKSVSPKDTTYIVVEHVNRNVEQPQQVYQGYRPYGGRLSLNMRIGRQPYGYGYQQRPQVIHNNFDNRNYYQNNCQLSQQRPQKPNPRYEPRSMPGGIPAYPTQNPGGYNPGAGGGIPSSPRSMPGGLR